MRRKHKVNRGLLRAQRKELHEDRIPIERGTPVRIKSLSLSRSERSTWAGKIGELDRLEFHQGMTIACVRVKLSTSYSVIRIPFADITPTEAGKEFVPLDSGAPWNPMQSPFAAPDAHVA